MGRVFDRCASGMGNHWTIFLGAAAVVTALAQPLVAQEDEGFGNPDAPAAAAPSPNNTPASTDAATPGAPKKERWLSYGLRSLGGFYATVFLLLSFTLVALFVMNLLTARRENVCPTGLIENFEAHLDAKKYQEAYDLAKQDESFLGHVLSAGLGKLSAGYAPAIEAMQEVGEEENMKLEHRLSYMALIGTLSPMIGLLGTVQGMIQSFNVIANAGGAPNPKALAGGISTALFTTMVGLVIAIPAIALYNILKNRISRLVLEVGIVSENLMSRFQNVGKDN